MIPIGYMAKRTQRPPGWLNAPQVIDIFSVSDCVNDDFTDFIPYWKHNGYCLFDSPEAIESIARDAAMNVKETILFYYEAHGLELSEEGWRQFRPDPRFETFETKVLPPTTKTLAGFDVVSLCDGPNSHSPLSCNSIAEHVKTNAHCLFDTLDEAIENLNSGAFHDAEPGPYRIYAVYTVDWPVY